jgi:hypothetical protein
MIPPRFEGLTKSSLSQGKLCSEADAATLAGLFLSVSSLGLGGNWETSLFQSLETGVLAGTKATNTTRFETTSSSIDQQGDCLIQVIKTLTLLLRDVRFIKTSNTHLQLGGQVGLDLFR